MFPKFFSHLAPLALLNVEHQSKCLSSLVRPELIYEVVHVDEQQIKVFNLFFALGRIWSLDQDVN
jgi:hypothetical protein